MTFKKLALVTAIACAPAVTFAVESLDDADLASMSGQDGIEIDLNLNVQTDAIVHDTDGIDASYAASYGSAGAIVISGMAIVANGVHVEIDAGDNQVASTGGAPVLNVNVDLTAGATLTTGSISVANSNRDDVGNPWGYGNASALLSSSTVTIGATDLNIQLGAAEPQGNMILVQADITSGLTISGFSLNDVTSLGSIGASTITLLNNDPLGLDTDLSVDVGIDVSAAGLTIDINALGSATGMDVRIVDQYLGTAGDNIGDVEIQGLNLANTLVTISGK